MEPDEIITALQAMETNPDLITNTAYRANAELWPTNRISFVDSHLAYLKAHPTVNPQHYLSNLRLMLRRRTPAR